METEGTKPSASLKTIGILSPIGTGNLGDEATVAAVIQSIRRRYPQARVYCFTTNPADTEKRHHITAYPAQRMNGKTFQTGRVLEESMHTMDKKSEEVLRERIKAKFKAIPFIYILAKGTVRGWHLLLNAIEESKFLARGYEILKEVDLLLIAGSGQLSDHFDGCWNFPWKIFKWSLLAKASKTRLVFLSVGAGPLNSKLSRWLVKYSLSLADYRSFRDEASKTLIQKIGMGGENPVFPDLAHNLHLDPLPVRRSASPARFTVGINPFPHYDSRYWHIGDPTAYSRYIEKLASFASWLLENQYSVLFFPTQVRADPLVIQDIKDVLKRKGFSSGDLAFHENPIFTLEELIARLSMLDLVVATRFHAILLSFLMNKPVLAISNHHKMSDLMMAMGQAEYLLRIDDFDSQFLIERFISLRANTEKVKTQISARVFEHQFALEKQYDLVLS